MAAGKFITLEGGEGAGKSTQAALLVERLTEAGHKTLLTREPGGSEEAERMRAFLLSGKAREFGAVGEAILFYAARDDHLEKTIRPALEEGIWVVCDRFSDSTRAYQGAAGDVKPAVLEALERVVVGASGPDLTIILDLPARDGLERARARAQTESGAEADRFEGMDIDFHQALRRRYLEIAQAEPHRCVVLDAKRPVSAVAEDVWETVVDRLEP